MNIRQEFYKNGYYIFKSKRLDLSDKFQSELKNIISIYLDKEKIDNKDIFNDGIFNLVKKDAGYSHLIYNIIRNSDGLYSFIYENQELINTIKEILQVPEELPIYSLYQVLRIDPPSDEKFILGWHQETYTTMPGTQSLQLWGPAIGRNDTSNGSIDILVDSHLLGELPHKIVSNNGYKSMVLNNHDEIEKKLDRKTIELDEGELLLFHPYLLHKSNINPGPRVRYSYTAHFINPLSDKFLPISYAEISELNYKRCVNWSDASE